MKTALDGKSFLVGVLVGALVVLTVGTVIVVLMYPKGARVAPPTGASSVATLSTSSVASNSPLEGSWYNERNPINPCSIVSGHPGLVVTDENGGFSRLHYDPAGFVIATDWRRGLRGELREGKIYWANGVVWVRAAPDAKP